MTFGSTPFLRFLLLLLLGIIIGQWVNSSLIIWIALIVNVLLFLLFYIKPNLLGYARRSWQGVFISIVFVLFGIVAKPQLSSNIPNNTENTLFVASAKSILKETPTKQSILFKCISKGDEETFQFNAVGYLRKDSTTTSVLPGDRFLIQSRLNTYKRTGNPYVFEYADYMDKRDINCFFYVNMDKVKVLESEFNISRYFLKLRQKAELHLQALNMPQKEHAIITALLLGNKDFLDYETKESFSESGAMHILAVSGLHLGVLFVLLSSLLGQIRQNNLGVLKVTVIIIVLWLYAAVSGFSPSIVRACIMFSVFLISKLISQKYNVYHALAIAAFIILLVNPYALVQVGFWLSFMAVTSIVYFFPLINKLLYFTKPWLRFVWDIISVSVAAQIGTVILSIFTFGFFPTWFLLSNILILPVLPVVLLSALLIVLTPINGFVANILGDLLLECLTYVSKLTFYISDLPQAAFTKLHFTFAEMICIYSLLITIVIWTKKRTGTWLLTSLSVIAIYLAINIHKNTKIYKQNFFVVSNVLNNSLIIQNQHSSSTIFYNDSLGDKLIKQTILPLVQAQKVDSIIYETNTNNIVTPLKTQNKNILLVNGKWDLDESILKEYNVDVFIITNKVPFATIKKIYDFNKTLLVFDSSFTNKGIRRLKKSFTSNVHYITESGAYVIKDKFAIKF